MKAHNKKAYLLVYGCQMNVSDAERMAGELASIGYARTDEMQAADLILINTCCVRESAEDRVYGKIGEIKHLKRKNPRLIFGITGCMAQKEGDALIARAPHIDFVLGTSKVHELKNIVQEIESERGLGAGTAGGAAIATATRDKHGRFVDVNLTETELPDGGPVVREGKLSAWIPIMYGCNNFCTYCIVPYVRGRERSVNSYGKDHKLADFADLLKMVDEVPGIERVRFMTSHPKDLSDKLIETITSGKHICEHIHLPVQYGSDKILSAMHRIYTVDSYRALVRRIRAAIPDVALTTDLIVGFPGETDEDFAQMLDFLREIRYDSAYTFIYSKRSGTPAAKMEDQVPDAQKHERLEKLMAVQNEISREINDELLGTVQEIMVEGPSKNDDAMWSGRTRTNKLVIFPHDAEQPGDFVNVKITHPQTWVLKGQRVF